MKKVLVVLVAAILLSATAAHALTKPTNAKVRGVVLFLGDSNLTHGAGAIEEATTYDKHWDNGYVPVIASRLGAGIRSPDCPGNIFTSEYRCSTFNYWSIRLPQLLSKIKPDAVVLNLGIVDDFESGIRASRGYAQYGAKIDWLMHLLPKNIPIFWTNLPCPLETAPAQAGCVQTNTALLKAGNRWKRFHLVNWAALAAMHPEWMLADAVHYTPDGNSAWAGLIVAALDSRLKYPT